RDGDAGPIRPVAPFFELWAKFQREGGGVYEKALTAAELERMGASLENLWYEVNVANRKVERRTGNASDSFVARAAVRAADYGKRRLDAFSPHTSGQEPLVFEDQPIPLGHFHVLKP